MTTAALIYDAWEGYDPTEKIAGSSAVHRLVSTFYLAGIRRTAIVSAENMVSVEKRCTKLGADFLYLNKKDKRTVGNCILTGISFFQGKYERLLFVPSYAPFTDARTYRALVESDAGIAFASHDGIRGFPLVVVNGLLGGITEHGGDLNAFLDAHADVSSQLDTDDAGVITDARVTPPDALTESLLLHGMHPKIKLSVNRETGFFGAGTMQLLRLTDETGSLNKACRLMGLAYSRGWTLIQNIERNLGFKALNTNTGGRKDKRWSSLTPECRAFLEKFEQFTDDVKSYADQAFNRYFDIR